jgi:DNA-binding IclR family transcriptional regulator
MTPKNLVQSVLRALSILELLDRKRELGVTEISESLQLDKSTAFRLISTLKHSQFIVQNTANSKYANSYKLFELGQNVLHQKDLIARAYPCMREISALTGETVNLAVHEGTEVVYVEKIETEDIVKISLSIGQRRPMYCTAVGKAILAYMPEPQMHDLVARFDYTPFTPTTLRDQAALLQELNEIRRAGYAVDNAEHWPGIRCAAMPLLNGRNEAIGAISVSVPIFKIKADPDRFSFCIDVLRKSCRLFSCRESGAQSGPDGASQA